MRTSTHKDALYERTKIGQITLTDLLGYHAASVAVLAVGFGLWTWGIGKLWGQANGALP